MNIYGKQVILRAMEFEDCDFVRGMFNDPDLEKMVIGWAFPVSKYGQEKWFADNFNDKLNFRFIIETKDGKEKIGIATLTDIDWKNRRATSGIKTINSGKRKKGLGTDTIMAVMRYAFDELQLNRLDACRFDDNLASKGLYTKCGWKEEGVRKEYIYKNGGYKDIVIMGILASDYRKLILENKYWEL